MTVTRINPAVTARHRAHPHAEPIEVWELEISDTFHRVGGGYLYNGGACGAIRTGQLRTWVSHHAQPYVQAVHVESDALSYTIYFDNAADADAFRGQDWPAGVELSTTGLMA